jgi:AhpC/TSA family
MGANAATAGQAAGRRGLAWSGLLLIVAGVVGYFFVVFHLAAWLPSVRNDALPNWLLVGAGLLLAIVAARRSSGRTAKVLLGVDLVLAGLFAVMLYVVPAVPRATGPTIGAPAPDFALLDQSGTTIRLAELRGAPVLLVFYRGHW